MKRYAHEWEIEEKRKNDNHDEDISNLFTIDNEEEIENTTLEIFNFKFEIKSLSNENRHTNHNTGLMLWEGAQCLSELIYDHPSLSKNKNILELGCGIFPLPSIISLKNGAKKCIITDGNIDVLKITAQNIKKNKKYFIKDEIKEDNLILRHLIWDSNKDCVDKILKDCNVDDLDMIIGADVLYSEDGIYSLFKLSRMLLNVKDSKLLLCFMIRNVCEKDILNAASICGFELFTFENHFIITINKIIKKFKIPIKFLCLVPILN